MPAATGLLAGLRVVDMSDGRVEMCGRFLADLGAEVVMIEPPQGRTSRRGDPQVDGTSIGFAFRNANKRSRIIDVETEAGGHELRELLASADAWLVSTTTSGRLPNGLDLGELRRANPSLVVLTVSDFGSEGPYASWSATDPVLLALAAVISRSGVRGRPPIIPPGELADDSGAFQAAWAVMVACYAASRTGQGDVLDFSRLEGATQILDPAFGAIGTAAAAMAGSSPGRGRPNPILYPIFPCRNGHVRFTVLAPRQWLGLRAWLGEPDAFADPKYEQLHHRFGAADQLYPLIAELCREQSALELAARGQQLGVPVAPVFTPAEVLKAEHFTVRRSFVELPLGPGRLGRAPSGHVLVNGERAGIVHAAPALDEHGDQQPWVRRPSVAGATRRGRPLDGVRVLDLGVIVAGGETGRLFADQGADVVKVENRHFPDGMRGNAMTPGFAATHRNKRGLGIDLRSPGGIDLFERLVAVADIVLTNFKPGTLESLGVPFARMQAINPGIVLVTSSAMGESGPWRDWMGYGPLVRCVSGMTSLWRDTGADSGFGDATTVFPDHLAARIAATAALAALARRGTTGTGAHIEVAQAETILNALGVLYTHASIVPGSASPGSAAGCDAPWGVYRCAGDDEWCVITVRDDQDWDRLVGVVGDPDSGRGLGLERRRGRVVHRDRIDAHLAHWTMQRDPRAVAEALQAVGVPAAPMLRVSDQPQDPQMVARQFFRPMSQPGIAETLMGERGPVRFAVAPEPDVQPAPFHGQDSREICRDWLDVDDDEFDELVARTIVQELSDADRQIITDAATRART